MKQYNVEVFDFKTLDFKDNTSISDFNYKYDYLDPQNYDIEVTADLNIAIFDWVSVKDSGRNFVGFVSAIKDNSVGTKRITLRDWLALADIEELLKISQYEAYDNAERFVLNTIVQSYAGNGKEYATLIEDLPLVGAGTRGVSEYDFEIEEIEEGTNFTKIYNCLDKFVYPAFKKYDIICSFIHDFNAKKITVDVSKKTFTPITIEADAVNILSKNIVCNKSTNQLTKIVIIDTDNYSSWRNYYLLSDGTWIHASTQEVLEYDRVHPTLLKYTTACATTTTIDGVEITKTFEENADIKADEMFNKNKYENYITLEVLADDELIKPLSMEIGQVVNIISEGKSYSSKLTGLEYDGETVKLIFGYVRYELTKILKGRG